MSRADGVDLDLLADYAAGVLDATAADDVARRVHSDDRWARALDALVAADDAVRADLRDLSESLPAGMPADVADRIETALDEAATTSATRGSVVSLAAARRHRRQRFLSGAGAAAAILVLALCGVTVLRGGFQGGPNATSGGLNQPEADRYEPGAAPPAAGPSGASDASTGPLIVATGLNYTQQELAELTGKPAAGPVPAWTLNSDKGAQPDRLQEIPPVVRQSAPEPLARLTSPDALATCVAAIQAVHPGTPILIDYARYEGRPALIVSVRLGTSTTVVAVGPNCGVGGADQIASATIP